MIPVGWSKIKSMNRFIKILNLCFYVFIGLYVLVWLYLWHNTKPVVYVHELNFILIWITTFKLGVRLGMKFLIKQDISLPKNQLLVLIALIVAHIIIHPIFVGSHSPRPYNFKWDHIFFVPHLMKNIKVFIEIAVILILTLLVFKLRVMYERQGWRMLRPVLSIVLLISMVITVALSVNHHMAKEHYLEATSTSNRFQDFIDRKELKGKYLYVDFWHSGCAPCISEFKKYEEFRSKLPEQIKAKVEFVFVGVDRNLPGELKKQQYYINKYHIDAKHHFISKDQLREWWKDLNPKEQSTPQFSYYYFLNPDGEVLVKDGPKFGKELEALFISYIKL